MLATQTSDSLVGLSHKVAPVREAAGHQSRMDVIERSLVDPGVFGIVNDEFKIRRNANLVSDYQSRLAP